MIKINLCKIEENWKPVVGYEGLYEVSDLGRVRSLDRIIEVKNRQHKFAKIKGRIISGRVKKNGYRAVDLYKKSQEHEYCLVHRLVLEAFVGKCQDGYQCCHSDGNPQNNRVGNLRWGTPKENSSDARKHGTLLLGEKSPRAKLSEDEVIEIKRLYRCSNISIDEIMNRYNIGRTTVTNIGRGDRWKHVEGLFRDNEYNKEDWKDIDGYDGKYKISSAGKIKSLIGVRFRIISGDSRGRVSLSKNNVLKRFSIKKLMKEYWGDHKEVVQ